MKDTDCYDVDRDLPNVAVGYTRDEQDGSWRMNTFLHLIRGCPAGGGYSTVGDLVRFATALRSGQLLEPATLEEFTRGKPESVDSWYGYGFIDERVRGHRIVGHGGGFPGINSNLDMFWDGDWVVAVMSNVDEGAIPVQRKARELIAR
jgi:CubicO group peptidase (beta-lactamase class C family)